MKQLRLALLVLVSAAGLVRAEDEENRAPPTDIPDFSNLDEYVYQPKSTLYLSMRMLSGAKASFSGTGKLLAPEDPGAATGTNVFRVYHDGAVSPDARTAGRTDSAGNPVIDPATNAQILDPVAPDGHTNTWSYTDARQSSEAPSGLLAFHSYSAAVTDTTTHQKATNSAYGVEVAVARDMGSLFHTRATWRLLAGMSLNDISAKTSANVQSSLTTLTDYYSLDGQAVPTAPYSAPSSSTTSVLDASNNPVLNADGTAQTVATDTTVLLGNQPLARVPSTTSNDMTSVTNSWKLKGAYFTFRAGPMISIPITTRLHADFAAGVALLYAGSDYTVTQDYKPEIGADITDTATSATTHLLPAYFADASLQFDLTEHAGLFAGAEFQGAGSYTQKLDTDTEHYQTKVNLGGQHGLRAGMTVRF